jgi:hypothetical protein
LVWFKGKERQRAVLFEDQEEAEKKKKKKKKRRRRRKNTLFLVDSENGLEVFNVKLGVLGSGTLEESDTTMEQEQYLLSSFEELTYW